MLKVTQGTISKVEADQMAPDLKLWYKLVTAFKVKNPFCFEDEKIVFKDRRTKIKIESKMKEENGSLRS